MRISGISVQDVLALEPACLRFTVPQEYADANGHMNMRWYLAIFDEAGDVLHDRVGLTREFHRQHGTGTFDLEHHTAFLAEVLPGDRVAVYARVVAQSAKRLHYLLFMLNEARGTLATVFECMNAFADLKIRRTAPFPPEIATAVTALAATHAKLGWAPPVCGAMQV